MPFTESLAPPGCEALGRIIPFCFSSSAGWQGGDSDPMSATGVKGHLTYPQSSMCSCFAPRWTSTTAPQPSATSPKPLAAPSLQSCLALSPLAWSSLPPSQLLLLLLLLFLLFPGPARSQFGLLNQPCPSKQSFPMAGSQEGHKGPSRCWQRAIVPESAQFSDTLLQSRGFLEGQESCPLVCAHTTLGTTSLISLHPHKSSEVNVIIHSFRG